MSVTRINPQSMGPEPAAYTNGVLAHGTTLYISGQIGIDASGACSSDFAAQCDQVWANLSAILADAGMTLENIVKTTVFLVDPAHYATFVERRKQALKGHKPASTLVYVSQLVKPEWKVEIEAVAVK
jgi:2-iminobutanoate/2-iminopropanoate deaminase